MQLGRLPRVHDERDFRLENFGTIGYLEVGPLNPVELAAIAHDELLKTTVTYKHWAASTYPDVTQTHWWKALNAIAQIAGPIPPAATGVLFGPTPEAVLDQGDYGTCVGNGSAQWGNTLPIDDKFTEKDARAIYYEATILDGSPDNPDAPGGGQQGATVKSGVRALKNRNRLTAYAESGDLAVCEDWLRTHGSIIVGTDWDNNMFYPDGNGYVAPGGGVAGGHCYLWDEITDSGDYGFLNSWGASWGKGGRFYMTKTSFLSLMNTGGECWTAVELPL